MEIDHSVIKLSQYRAAQCQLSSVREWVSVSVCSVTPRRSEKLQPASFEYYSGFIITIQFICVSGKLEREAYCSLVFFMCNECSALKVWI